MKGLAYSLDLQGKRDDAIYYYFLAVRADSGDDRLYINLLAALYDAGRYEDLITYGERALKAFPNEVAILIYLSWSYFLSGEPELAVQRIK